MISLIFNLNFYQPKNFGEITAKIIQIITIKNPGKSKIPTKTFSYSEEY
jgi:hypothetical protein